MHVIIFSLSSSKRFIYMIFYQTVQSLNTSECRHAFITSVKCTEILTGIRYRSCEEPSLDILGRLPQQLQGHGGPSAIGKHRVHGILHYRSIHLLINTALTEDVDVLYHFPTLRFNPRGSLRFYKYFLSAEGRSCLAKVRVRFWLRSIRFFRGLRHIFALSCGSLQLQDHREPRHKWESAVRYDNKCYNMIWYDI